MTKGGVMFPVEFGAVETSVPRRVGIDIGWSETRVVLRDDAAADGCRVYGVPTLISYSRPEAEPVRFSCIGDKAVSRRDHMRLVHPFRPGLEKRGHTVREFARHLRELFRKRGEPSPWAVVNCPAGATEEDIAMRRGLANDIFDRVLFVDETFLLALGHASQEVSQHGIIIDVGATSIRAALMHGEAPSPEERVEVPFGGNRLDETLRKHLSMRFPELMLTDWTLARMKEKLAFVPPARPRCTLKLQFRGKERLLDLTEVVQEASAAIVRPLLRAAKSVLARCPSDEVEAFQRNVVLAGGGADLLGLVERVQGELRADGFELARVHKASDPRLLVARGAFKWAQLLRDDQWAIPLFSFAQ